MRVATMRACGVLAMVLVLAWLSTGCGEEDGDGTNSSPIHAVASVLLVEDEVGPQVEARLIVLRETDGGDFVFIEELTDVIVTCSDCGLLDMEKQLVRLAQPEGGGTALTTNFHQLLSRSESALEYRAGETYTIQFTIDDSSAGDFNGERFSLSVQAPSQQNVISKASEEAVNKKLEIVSDANFPAGILEVKRLDNSSLTTFVSFPYKEDFMSSPTELIDAIDTGDLNSASGSLLTVPSEAFPSEGTHSVTYLGLGISRPGSSLSGNLGRFSVAIAGEAVELEANVR